ncbi:MAG: N-acetyl-gamma-glutamyl-phosphate reductase [Aquiluna sp.]|nr:N-acetyl-gamma-glutamyl-phosphate reductase [Aquiluna sp.]
MTIQVAVAGASGYVGGELLRLISAHPMLDLGAVTGHSNVGQSLGLLQPHIPEFADRIIVETSPENLAGHEVVFLALPHTKSAEIAESLPAHTMIIDCGADFRLQDSSAWESYYQTAHAGSWPYGMPELTLAGGGKLRTELREVRRLAIPGCNVTAVSLALAPALTAGMIEPDDIVSVLSVGTSGAGKASNIDLLAAEVLGSARAYGVGGVHRHTPEIEQNLALAAGKPVTVSMTPVLVPMSRGILAVNTAKPSSRFSLEYLRDVYASAYGDETFVQVLPEGQLPRTASVLGSNNTQISLSFDDHANRVVIVSAIDNLVKGTAGAAIQSMNIALGLTEQTGLDQNGVAP